MKKANEMISETEEKKEENGMEMKAGKRAVRRIADGIQNTHQYQLRVKWIL